MLRKWIFSLLILVIGFASATCLLLPFLAHAIVDYRNVDAHWVDQAKSEFNFSFRQTTAEKLGEIERRGDLPFSFSIIEYLILSFFLLQVAGFLCYRLQPVTVPDSVTNILLLLQVGALLIAIVTVVTCFTASENNMSVVDALMNNPNGDDQVLVERVVQKIHIIHLLLIGILGPLAMGVGINIIGSELLLDNFTIPLYQRYKKATDTMIDRIRQRCIAKWDWALAPMKQYLEHEGTFGFTTQGLIRKEFLVGYKYLFKIFPIPIIRVSEARCIPYWKFFEHVFHDAREEVMQRCREGISTIETQQFRKVGYQASFLVVSDLVQRFTNKVNAKFDEYQELSGQEGEISRKHAHELLLKVSDRTLLKFKEQVLENLGEMIEESLDAFREDVVSEMRKRIQIQNASVDVTDEAILFPDKTRFFLKRGSRAIFVIQHSPQVRTTRFDGEFVQREFESSRENHTENATKRSFELAFPYVVAVIHFCQGVYSKLSVFYRKEPLRSIDDELFFNNLPNGSREVCLGGLHVNSNLPMHLQCDELLGRYYDGIHNTDMIDHYTSAKDCDPRLRSIWEWERQSALDPYFMTSVDWESLGNMTIRSIMKEFLGRDEPSADSDALAAAKQIADSAVGVIAEVTENYCTGIHVERNFDQYVSDALTAYINKLKTMLMVSMMQGFRDLIDTTRDTALI